MSILGLNGDSAHAPKRGSHDSGACLLDDQGVIIAAVNEERFSRIKQDVAFPFGCLDYLSKQATFDQLKAIGLCWLSAWQQKPLLDRLFAHLKKTSQNHADLRRFYWKQQHARWSRLIMPHKRTLPKTLQYAQRAVHEHHQAHAASAYYCCPWPEEKVLCLTLDGQGDFSAASVWLGQAGKLQAIEHYDALNSIGHLYAAFTAHLGFTANRHEGKIVGLAAYGDAKVLQERLLQHINLADWHALFDADLLWVISRPHQQSAKDFMQKLCQGLSREDIAAGIQKISEILTCAWVQQCCEQHQTSLLALAGGVFANVKLNQRILELDCVDNLYVHPNMGDGGLAVGAALLAHAAQHPDYKPQLMPSCYLGPDISASEAIEALTNAGLTYQQTDQLAEQAAELLASGKVVARAAGRMEYGPRALGNRTLFASCNDPKINQWLNDKLQRTEFMPFAPIILEEHAQAYFPAWKPEHVAARFMTLTYDASDLAKAKIPAAIHIDGTARPQVLRQQDNPEVHAILSAYYDKTGIAALINTSFNMHEEPIVCSAFDAVRAFQLGHLDALICGPVLCTENHHENP